MHKPQTQELKLTISQQLLIQITHHLLLFLDMRLVPLLPLGLINLLQHIAQQCAAQVGRGKDELLSLQIMAGIG